MQNDQIVDPGAVAGLIREYLGGEVHPFEAAYRVMRLAGSGDRILAGHQTEIVREAYWALRRLAESDGPERGRRDLAFLLDCLEGRRRFPRA